MPLGFCGDFTCNDFLRYFFGKLRDQPLPNASGVTSISPVYPALAKQRILVVQHNSLFP